MRGSDTVSTSSWAMTDAMPSAPGFPLGAPLAEMQDPGHRDAALPTKEYLPVAPYSQSHRKCSSDVRTLNYTPICTNPPPKLQLPTSNSMRTVPHQLEHAPLQVRNTRHCKSATARAAH